MVGYTRRMPDREQLILTAIGPDQVGLVEQISRFISRRDCNIEDSKMAVFCGEFAVIVLISGETAGLRQLAEEYRELESETSLSVSIKTPAARKTAEASRPYRLTASCMDHPGVVYQISGVLSSLGVNIESLETKTYSAPVSGTPLFQLQANVSVPVRTNINVLRDRIAEIQREQNIDIELSPLSTAL